MKLRTIPSFICAALTTLVLSACSESQTSNQQANQPAETSAASAPAASVNSNAQTVLVATEANFLPLRYRDGENTQPTGFQIEVLAAAGKAAGLNFTYELTPNAPDLDKLATENYVATLATFDATSENQEKADFTKAITTTKYVVHLKSDSMGTGSLADLQGKTISIDRYYASNPAYLELLEKLTGSKKNIVIVSHVYPAWRNMVLGETDGVFAEDLILDYTYTSNKDKMDVKVKAVDLGLPANERALLLKKGNPELLAKINAGIDAIKADGTYDNLKNKWFPEIK